MRKSGLALLLLVCFLISLPVAASDLESVEVQSLMSFVQPPETILFSLPEEITINQRGEVPVLSLQARETNIYDVVNFNIPLLEFQVDSNESYKLYGKKVLTKGGIIIATFGKPVPEWSGGADLFCNIQHSNFQTI